MGEKETVDAPSTGRVPPPLERDEKENTIITTLPPPPPVLLPLLDVPKAQGSFSYFDSEVGVTVSRLSQASGKHRPWPLETAHDYHYPATLQTTWP